MRATEAVVDLGAIGRNVEAMRALVAPAEVCAVTKADAYGHGAVAVSRVALDAGASMIAVALVEEGIELRRSGVRAPILLLSEPRPDEMFEVVDAGLTPTVYTANGIAALVAAAGFSRRAEPVDVHLNLDTGMNRVGHRPDRSFGDDEDIATIVAMVRAIADKPGLRLTGVWTHFAVADEPARPETQRQIDRFDRALDSLASVLPPELTIHAANSAAALTRPDARRDMIRLGIALYGVAPHPDLDGIVDLEPSMSLRTAVGLVKPVRAGEGVSYGLAHTFDRDTTLATIPMGYADGMRRDLSMRGGQVLIGGRRCRLVGAVTMDQAMVDLGPDTDVQSGDEVVIVGRQGDEQITASEIALRLDTIAYEVVCDVGRRVRRRYL